MNCKECKDEMYLLLEENADSKTTKAIVEHIAECNTCSETLEEMNAIITTLTPCINVKAPPFLKQNIINEINKNTTVNKNKTILFTPLMKRVLSVAAIVAIVLLVIPFINKKSANTINAASSVFESAISATDNLKNMVIKFSIRTNPSDNFALIDKDCNMVEHTLIKSFDKPIKWIIQKPGRTVFFDGNNQYLWMPESREAIKGTKNAGFTEWLKILLEPTSILWKEKEAALTKEAIIKMHQSEGNLMVTVTSNAEGNFMNDYLKNKSIRESDNRREYVFDSKTKRLKGLKIYLLENHQETLIFNLEDIQYDVAIKEQDFTVSLPEDVDWKILDLIVKNETFSNTDSKSAAELIFEAISRNDFESNKEVWTLFNAVTKKVVAMKYGGLTILKIGEPFKSGLYPGEFIPYEVKLKDGTIKSYKLALRNDNPNKVWMVDGGL